MPTWLGIATRLHGRGGKPGGQCLGRCTWWGGCSVFCSFRGAIIQRYRLFLLPKQGGAFLQTGVTRQGHGIKAPVAQYAILDLGDVRREHRRSPVQRGLGQTRGVTHRLPLPGQALDIGQRISVAALAGQRMRGQQAAAHVAVQAGALQAG